MASMSLFAQAVAGALCVVLSAGVVYLGVEYALGAFDERYEVDVVLGELGQGIVTGSDVKIREVVVGEVADIRLDADQHAVATLSLEPRYAIPQRASYAVNAKTLLGEKQVEVLFDGAIEDGPHLPDGATVADAERVVEFQDVLADLAELFEAVNPDDLAVLVADGLGAFHGQGPTIARSVEQGARAASAFRVSLDDQIAAQRDLSLVAERLSTEGATFNRMAAELARGLPTVSDNQVPLRVLLDELGRFSAVLNATLVVDRANLDHMIVDGDSVTRMLAAYSLEIGEVLTGLVQYTEKYPRGFVDEGFDGQAARFQVIVDDYVEAELCHDLPPELATQLPLCEGHVDDGAAPAATGTHRDVRPPLLELPAPPALTRPEVLERHGVEVLFRRSLTAPGGSPARGTR